MEGSINERLFTQYMLLNSLSKLSEGYYSINRELNEIRVELNILKDEVKKAIEEGYVEERLNEMLDRSHEISEKLFKTWKDLCEEIERKYEWLR